MRSGFLVTSHRKKLWNVQIGLINEFARICKKHNLRWFAYGGTLLGAARHNGFIPWDDDVDLMMLRPDYEKFKVVAAKEIQFPYYLDAAYNYRYEGDENPLPEESNLTLITVENRKKAGEGLWPYNLFLKIRDSRTTMVELPDRKQCNQGIWIDIFPMDPVPPFEDNQKNYLFLLEREIFLATIFPQVVKEAIQKNQKLISNPESMKTFLQMTQRQRCLYFEKFLADNYYDSDHVWHILTYFYGNSSKCCNPKLLDEVVYLPFEKIELPCPSNYDEILTTVFGNWHKMIYTHSHVKDWSVDIPYTEYFKESAIQPSI